ncbi:hypothetical protein [Streptomyces sp. NBC_01262]|uniref:hypothetical protein n=1 Tax=Streptomyces sp. NBC_01262 TaxID=2903803 RepID=UPI002E31F7A3|nr:hypothetical protein [Streptomyces sp. NBC_01262]
MVTSTRASPSRSRCSTGAAPNAEKSGDSTLVFLNQLGVRDSRDGVVAGDAPQRDLLPVMRTRVPVYRLVRDTALRLDREVGRRGLVPWRLPPSRMKLEGR